MGYHFNGTQLGGQFIHLIYHPNLDKLIRQVVHTCSICILTQPKQVRNLIGSRRTDLYLPGQNLVLDSLYLPKSRLGNSKALIIVDSCTSRISLFESKDLKASSVRRHIKTYFQCQPLSQYITCNLGTEFRQELDVYLAGLGIQLLSTKPFNKGSTAVAESSIRLVKAALRKYCPHYKWTHIIQYSL